MKLTNYAPLEIALALFLLAGTLWMLGGIVVATHSPSFHEVTR